MKKLLIALAFVGMTTAAFAQEETPTKKYSVATNGFWNNWFVQVGADYNVFYSNEERDLNLNSSPFKSFRSTPGFSVGIGKWFTPGLGLRTKFQGLWGRTVVSEDADINKNNMFFIQEQAMFNINNILCGYNPNRIWHLSIFGGLGVAHENEIGSYAMSFSAGLHSSWKLSNAFNIYLEGGLLFNEHDMDAVPGEPKKNMFTNHDRMPYAEIGLTYNLGKTGFTKTPDVDAINALHQAQIDALNAQLNDANAEKDRLAKLLKECQNRPMPEPKTIKEVAATPVSVFFNINKTKVASKKDLVDVQEIANYAKENNSKLVVTGYADSATGSAPYNQTLSEKRANTVADILVNMGVSRDNITTVAEGGVNSLSPISYNRRATVKIAE